MSHAVGIDVGSTNVKVALVADDGTVVGTAARTLDSRREGDVAEQDAEAMWTAVVDAVRSVTVDAPSAAGDVTDLCVCSQYSSIGPVDRRARPVDSMIMWSDQRGTSHSWAIMDEHPDAFEVFIDHHGIPPVGSGLALGHILHLQHNRPDVYAATTAFLEPMDYVNARLTGALAATQCTMFMSQVCDNRTVGVTDYDDELVGRAGVDVDKLPSLIPVDGVVGPILPEVARELGLPEAVTVHAAMNDSHAGAFASDAFRSGRGGLAIGTTAVVLDTVDEKKTDLDNELVSMPSPVPGRYLAWAENGIAGKAVEHVLENIVFADDELADHVTGDCFAALDTVLVAAEQGSGGVLFLPWLSGSLAPEASGSMRGGFVNLSLETRRTDLVRAMIEGTAHNLRWLLPALESFTGNPIEELVFYGGAARSTGWAQILADVLCRPVHTLDNPDFAVARTMGLLALQRSGRFPDGLDAFVDIALTHDPRADDDPYAPMHEQFCAAFEALRPICEALNG